jgi:hypothetical protein
MTRIAFAFVLLLLTHPAQAQLRGHGGPVRALAISADGQTAVSGSFDSSVIRWSLPRNAADQVLRFHQSAVNAVALTPDGRTVTGGEDGKIAIWQTGSPTPQRVLEGHVAPVVSLAVSPDGTTLASASWDRTIRLWSLTGGEQRVLEDHQQNVNGVAFTPDGKALVSAAYDLTLRIWPLDGGAPTIITLPTPLNSVAVAMARSLPAVPTAACSSFRHPVHHTARSTAARRRSSPSPYPVTVRSSPPPASAARWRSSTVAPARSFGHWSAPDCRYGRRRSFPTTAHCSPAAPTA